MAADRLVAWGWLLTRAADSTSSLHHFRFGTAHGTLPTKDVAYSSDRTSVGTGDSDDPSDRFGVAGRPFAGSA